jgi:phage FluMu gp28-like protein
MKRLADSAIELLDYQYDLVTSESRFTWNCWARQTGKSFSLSLRRLLRGIARRRNQIILSAGMRQTREVFQKIREHCSSLNIWCEQHEYWFYRDLSIRQLEIALPSGVRIIGLPANPLTARGYTGDVLLDEFAMHQHDEDIWKALYPTLLRSDGELDIASTPRGCKNKFYDLRNNILFAGTTVNLADAIMQGLTVDPTAARAGAGDELTWRQEFCCEFVDEATSFMSYELIRSCHDERLDVAVDWTALTRPGVELYVGIDIGRKHDLTAIWVWQRDEHKRFVTRGVVTMQNTPFCRQKEAIDKIMHLRAVRRASIDATGMGAMLAEELVAEFGDHRVEAISISADLKSQMAGALRVAAERGMLRIPCDEAITRDWHAISRLVTSAGHVRFDADRGADGHADRFWAAALGLHAADAPSGPPGVVTSGRLAFSRIGAW